MESAAARLVRAHKVVRLLARLYPDAECALHHDGPLQLLVATILSAQCTDERVNSVTPVLFGRYQTAEDFASSDPDEMEGIIHACGFFRNKTRSIRATGAMLQDRFDGEVPQTMAELITLPGVARKTANVVLSHAFNRNEGIAVDTHVQRLTRRLDLSRENSPEKIERDLMALLPSSEWGYVSDLLIWHGRRRCYARKPDCSRCEVFHLCPSGKIFLKNGTALQLDKTGA